MEPIRVAAAARGWVLASSPANECQGAPRRMTEPTSVLVVAAVRLYREGLSQALRERGFNVVGDPSVDRGLDALADVRPDVVLVTADPRVGVDEIQAVMAAAPDARVVALAVPDAEGAIVACAEAGAAGFVTADESIEDLARAITNAAHDELGCSPSITAALARRLATLAGEQPPVDATARLTRREVEISDYLRSGLSNKEIASQLHIEVATVKNHVHNILEKLGLNRRTEVARHFERSG
jgi:two-component system, NarL family, nitrate/nitrite response regulator NarL